MSQQTIRLPEVDDETNATVARLNKRLTDLAPRNAMLDAYYDAERNMRRMHGGIVPEQYYRLGLVLGWAAKGVDALARRCNLEGMVWADGDLDSLGFRDLWNSNRLGSETDQGITSALVHGPAYVVASRGGDGEPLGLIHYYSATNAMGTRNARTRRLDDLLVINERDDEGEPSALTLYLPDVTVTAVKDQGRWEVDESPNVFGEVTAAPLLYSPRLNKPMGRTRITRPVRGFQDAAARALVRLEGHMDVYAYPEFWMLGADPSVFKDADGNPLPEWQQRLGRIKGIPDDKDEDEPSLARADVKQFSAASPSPHLADLNTLAKLTARELSLPDSALALTDLANPTSAEAYDASQYELIGEAEGAQDEFSPALEFVTPFALAMQNGLSSVPAEWLSIAANWRPAQYETRAAQADAGQKQLASVPWLAETEVGLELLGLDPQQIDRAVAERQRAQARANLTALVQTGQASGGVESAAELKAKFDALGVAIRAGVEPEDAAAQLGLQGTRFTGAIPVSLRVPESQAPGLEDR